MAQPREQEGARQGIQGQASHGGDEHVEGLIQSVGQHSQAHMEIHSGRANTCLFHFVPFANCVLGGPLLPWALYSGLGNAWASHYS